MHLPPSLPHNHPHARTHPPTHPPHPTPPHRTPTPPHTQRLRKGSWRDVRYKGDPMLRPIASFELGMLVRVLVGASRRANALLGLDRTQGGREEEEEGRPETRLQVRGRVCVGAVRALCARVGRALHGCCSYLPAARTAHRAHPLVCHPPPYTTLPHQDAARWLRRRGWRVNLRPLADVRNLAWIPITLLLLRWALHALLWLAWAVANAPAALEDAASEQQRWQQQQLEQRQQQRARQQQHHHEW